MSTLFVVHQWRDYRKENSAQILGLYRSKENALKKAQEAANAYAIYANYRINPIENGFVVHDGDSVRNSDDCEYFKVSQMPILD